MAPLTSEPERAPRVKRGHELVRPAVPLRATGPLSAAEVDAFYRDGFVVARGLVSGALLERARLARARLEVPAGRDLKYYAARRFRLWDWDPAFRELAVDSPLCAAAAQLTPAAPRGACARALVVLRDALFVLRGANPGCGFHVDDAYFWPAPADAPGPGVSAWLALDDVGPCGGGIALARGSHDARFLDCRDANEAGTCTLPARAPALARRLEAVAVAPQMRAGDAVLHTRFLFHRGDPFRPGAPQAAGPGIARYSVRYMPGHAEALGPHFRDGRLVTDGPLALADADPVLYPAWTAAAEPG